jgi:3-hydroxyisobutyrate dehydrogenase-like beta-hydroxyacid dehydrogenase
MGSSVTLTGPVGAGNTTKLANQIMVACNIAAMGEALTLATRCGLNPEVVLNAVKGGLAGSAVLNAKGADAHRAQLQARFKIKSPSKRPAQRAADGGGKQCLPAFHCAGAADDFLADCRWIGRPRSLRIATFVEEASHVEVKVPV